MDWLLTTWIFELFGRLHPMLVHFPIGLLIGAFFLECWKLLRKDQKMTSGINAFVYIGAFFAVIAALMGWLLQQNEGYSGSTVENHRITGIITVLLSIITGLVISRRQYLVSWIPFFVLALTVISVTVTGHLGASLTHGENYLTEVLPGKKISDPPIDYSAQLATFKEYSGADSIPDAKLDRLNLEVRAIFAHNCYQCHSIEKRKGDLALDHKEGVFAGGEHGPILQVGNSSASEVIRKLTLPRDHEEAMPPKGKTLKPDEIKLISLWIDLGAHWADSGLKVFKEAELALEVPNLPNNTEGISHPVDRILHEYFQDRDLSWPQPVDDRTFVRRVYLDIIGLLPEPQHVNTFMNNPSPDKREALIDQLLEDKHNYAQHWLSFWNDLLRNDYSGTGYITGGRKQISDWLYYSLLENKPYNQMVGELVNPTKESEGFIKGIQWRGVVNSSQTTEMQAAQNISQSLLGLNLKCASCHNSFVNNLTLDQAYGFANVFSDTILQIFRCDNPTGRMANTSFLYPELGSLDGEDVEARLEKLEELMTTPENGRMYRTIVNRYWDLLFGRGIVMPVDEMDNLPWNQKLLDWLASDLIAHNYDLKHLLKTILTSRAYQLPSVTYESVDELFDDQYTFYGPAPRRISAEQFADGLSKLLSPLYHSVAYDPSHRSMSAEWIWHREIELDRDVLPKPGKRYFRYTFSLENNQKIRSAELLLSVDHSHIMYLNGKKVSQGDDWRKVSRFDVAPILAKEKNVIAIEGENEGRVPNPAGVLLSLLIEYEDGTTQEIYSHTAWKSSETLDNEHWINEGFNDENWPEVRRYGSFESSYWGILLDFDHEIEGESDFARASLVMRDPFMTALGRPTRENVATQRSDQATLLQALELTNGTFFHETIKEGAVRWKKAYGDNPERLVEQLYLHFLGRVPTEKESKILRSKLGENPKEATLEDIIWSIVLLPEFQLIL